MPLLYACWLLSCTQGVDDLLSLLDPEIFSREFLVKLLEKTSNTTAHRTLVGLPGTEETSIQEDLPKVYDNAETYNCATHDRERNRWFKQSIERQKLASVSNWLEIGPGAHGVLTKLVLESYPDRRVTAIEYVQNSIESLHLRMKKYVSSGRLEVNCLALLSAPLTVPGSPIFPQ